jgi:hypothetical protein
VSDVVSDVVPDVLPDVLPDVNLLNRRNRLIVT